MQIIRSHSTESKLSYLGRLKSKVLSYILDKDSILALELTSTIKNSPEIRTAKITGKLTIHLHLGGVQSIELTQTETFRPSSL